jgi:ABC-2 type transport system permease protein
MCGNYKHIILFLTYKNLQLKYKHSALGFLWSLLHPFLYLLIFLVIFSTAFPMIENYPLFVLSGLVFWIYFSGATNQLCNVFIKNTHLIKSLNLPKTIYPLTELLSELFSFILALIPFLVIMYYMDMNINFNLLYIIPVILLFSVFIFAIGIILGSLNVFFRDVGILWNTINPALFYLTPIVYTFKIVPVEYRFIMRYNPLFHFFELIRNVLYDGQPPSEYYLVRCLIITGVACLIAIIIYRKTRNGFISNL